ncbi:hypothetical protein JCM11251_001478 [Rhodosporidiobolus azoricus]
MLRISPLTVAAPGIKVKDSRMDDYQQYATVRRNGLREEAPASGVPSIVLSPASPSQPAHSYQTSPQTATRQAGEGGENERRGEGKAVSSKEGAGGGGEAERGERGSSATGLTEDGQAGGGTASAPAMSPKPSCNGASTSSTSRRPSTAPSPSPSSALSPSNAPASAPAPPSESRTFFASLASSFPSLPLPSLSLNLTSFLPSKLPGTPTLHVVGRGEGDGRESFESEGSEGYVGFDEEGQEEERERRRRRREEKERRSMDLRIEEALGSV